MPVVVYSWGILKAFRTAPRILLHYRLNLLSQALFFLGSLLSSCGCCILHSLVFSLIIFTSGSSFSVCNCQIIIALKKNVVKKREESTTTKRMNQAVKRREFVPGGNIDVGQVTSSPSWINIL